MGKATHMPQVPQDPSSLLVVDVRCLDKLGPSTTSGVAGAIKLQGWAVLPLFGGSSASVDSGLHMLPILEGAPHLEALSALSRCASMPPSSWQRAIGKLVQEKKIK